MAAAGSDDYASRLRAINPQAAAILEEEERLERLERERILAQFDDDADSHSDDSHESHSSHESYAERHGMKDVKPPAPILPPLVTVIGTLVFLLLAQSFGLYLFTKGFLLTRTELEGVSQCDRTFTDATHQNALLHKAAQQAGTDLKRWESALLTESECTLPQRYSKTLMLIVDALRYDFIAPIDPAIAAAGLSDPRTQGVVVSISDALKAQPRGTFLSHAFADPPTTTLQRLKALTTGVLPTFIDMGSNFGGSEIVEDNFLAQYRRKYASGASESNATSRAGMAFMGDDTWMSLFPAVFDTDWTWPSDSFVVDDLDSVDASVRQHLAHFLPRQSARNGDSSERDWRLIIAHNLGLDHAGHRFGPSHPELKRKLQELNTQVSGILSTLPEDALFILLGDHGMDAQGDHGGEGELETSAGLFMYSKKNDLSEGLPDLDISDLPAGSEPSYREFSPLKSLPGTDDLHRSITQIDLVPSLSLLNGLPIPFNSLGTIIPELFPGDLLLRALRINALQIHQYLRSYTRRSTEFRQFQAELDKAWQEALSLDKDAHARSTTLKDRSRRRIVANAYYKYNRLALARARQVWARFDFLYMGAGLCVMLASIFAAWRFRTRIPADDADALATFGRGIIAASLSKTVASVSAGIVGAAAVSLLSRSGLLPNRDWRDALIIGSAAASIALLVLLPSSIKSLSSARAGSPRRISADNLLFALIAGVHCVLPASNSFLLVEDRAVSYMVQAVLAARGIAALKARSDLTKIKGFLFAVASMVLVRLMSTIRICREEPGPSCQSTFFQTMTGSDTGDTFGPAAAAASTTNSLTRAAAAYAVSYALPSLLQSYLKRTGSSVRLTDLLINWVVRPTTMMGAGYWLLDTALGAESLHRNDASIISLINWAKLAVSRIDMVLLVCAAVVVWPASPLPLQLRTVTADPSEKSTDAGPGPKQRATLVGYRNVLGSSFLVLFLILFAMMTLLTQPSGQLALAASVLILLFNQELAVTEAQIRAETQEAHAGPSATSDSISAPASTERWSTENARPLQLLTVALVGHLAFFSTGHQATISSIQWRIAFVGLTKVIHPYSGILVAINSFGALTLWPAFATVLLVLWQRPPRPRGAGEGAVPLYSHLLRAALLLVTWQALVTFSTSIFAVHFRRHLMLFKIWAPRYMLAGVSLIGVTLALILAISVASIATAKASHTFGTDFWPSKADD